MNQTTGFKPSHSRQFYLTEGTIQRLGGEQAKLIMERLVTTSQTEVEIQTELGLSPEQYDELTKPRAFHRELSAQRRIWARTEKQLALKQPKRKPPPERIPPAVTNVSLPKGVSATDYAIKRIGQVTPEAVEKLIWLMQHSRQENIQYNSAIKLLGLNGIVEVEKSISVIADAEAIIRELNRRGPYKAKEVEIDAEVIEGGERLTPGDSEASAPSIPTPIGAVDGDNQSCGPSFSGDCV